MSSPFSDPQQRIAFFQQWFSDTIPHSKALGLKVLAVARGLASMQLDWRPELVGNFTQARQHVLHDRWGRRGAVKFPNDHRNAAGFTLGNPADIILIPPRRQPGGSAQIAAR